MQKAGTWTQVQRTGNRTVRDTRLNKQGNEGRWETGGENNQDTGETGQ